MAKSHPFIFTMEKFCVHILGCGSAKPTLRHMPTAQIVELHGKYYMIDCGEGVQVTMQRLGLPMHRIGHIFISHNHGDHIFGLPGLLQTIACLGRTEPLYFAGPEGLERAMAPIFALAGPMPFEIRGVTLSKKGADLSEFLPGWPRGSGSCASR